MYDFLFDDNGDIRPKGSSVRRTEYAEVLKRIAEDGADAFYTGSIAQGMVKEVQAQVGVMTVEDLASKSTSCVCVCG